MQRYYGRSDGRFTLDGNPECAATAQNESVPDSFESWDARRPALPRSLLTASLRYELKCGNGSDVLRGTPLS